MALSACAVILAVAIKHVDAKPNYCLPSLADASEIETFSNALDGQLVTVDEPYIYESYVAMTMDTYYTAYPSFVAVCFTAQDIQAAVSFASSHRIQISICSTGHSYSGRNTANFSLQINLSKMQHYALAADASAITVETGMHWGQIYPIVDSVCAIDVYLDM